MATLSESSSYWTSPAMSAQNMLGLWFAASHQPWMNLNFILMEVCARKDWQKAIRQEIEANAPLNDYKTLDELPLLDSFMKETVRLTPLDTMAIRRKAVHPYNFSDGTGSVPQGATVCVPAYEMMHDAARYPDPYLFKGARFVCEGGKDQRKFTQVAHDFPIWGYGSLAW
jgi:cytochrome P450